MTKDQMAASPFVTGVNHVRTDIKRVAGDAKFLADIAKKGEHTKGEREDTGEVIANLQLAYRHLEDASMRLGKALQAHDGGVSVYDKATTVGA